MWEADGQAYRPTAIVSRILLDAAGSTRSTRGPSWWVLPDGRSLTDAAGPGGGGPFDWDPLHALMASIPIGRWTTYGDLAELVGTAAQPLGQHIMRCSTCANAQRVLGGNGRASDGFAWTDPSDTRTQQRALEEEGVEFSKGVAADAQRIRAGELRAAT